MTSWLDPWFIVPNITGKYFILPQKNSNRKISHHCSKAWVNFQALIQVTVYPWTAEVNLPACKVELCRTILSTECKKPKDLTPENLHPGKFNMGNLKTIYKQTIFLFLFWYVAVNFQGVQYFFQQWQHVWQIWHIFKGIFLDAEGFMDGSSWAARSLLVDISSLKLVTWEAFHLGTSNSRCFNYTAPAL